MSLMDRWREIEHVLREQGSLSKEDILAVWPMPTEQYVSLQEYLLAQGGIRLGSRGTGGFRIVERRRQQRGPEAEVSIDRPTMPEWELQAAIRLAELLSYKALEELLGELLYTVRHARKERSGEDRRGSKAELARALIVQHGQDLFVNGEIRKSVAAALKLAPPKSWHSGKGRARQFVADAGFPKELAGVPADETPPDYEYIEPRASLSELADFQREVQQELIQVLEKPRGKGIVTLPTGAGKTRVAVDTIREWMMTHRVGNGGTCVVWLAHTEELCEQAYACFKQVWEGSPQATPLWLFRFWGRYTKDVEKHRGSLAGILDQPSVLVSTPTRLRNLVATARSEGEQQLVQNLHRRLRLIIIDEAHRAAAPTYREILRLFSADESSASIVGLTATPFRQEYLDDPTLGTRELKEIFNRIIEPLKTLGEDPRDTLVARGILARPEPQLIPTRTMLSAPLPDHPDFPTVEEIEKIDYALKLKADTSDRRIMVFARLVEIARDADARVLYFGPSVKDAECMAFLLREAGIKAAALSARTRDVTRRRLIDDFRAGTFNVLCNCEVLTTGFDAPKVSHVVMARPTVSQVLYEQMVGRGLRGPKFGGTERCVILDCDDNYKQGRPELGYKAFRHLWLAGEQTERMSA